MQIESNGQRSCGEKSRHIDIRYFIINDIIKREDIELVHCPTERMIADYYTKPLQGSLFRKIRDKLMGLTPFPEEERVGLNEGASVGLNEGASSKLDNKMSIVSESSEKCSGGVSRNITNRKSQIKRVNGGVTYADVVRTKL